MCKIYIAECCITIFILPVLTLHVSQALAAMSTTVAVFCVKCVLRQEKELSIAVPIHDSRTRF
jgi:hypothetical protein